MTWQAELDSTGDTAVLRLHGDLDLLVEPPLRQALNEVCTGYRHVLLDLADVRLIDSTGLGLLVRAHQNAKRNQGVVCLLSPSRFILTVLHTMRLHPVFPVFPDEESAISWLAQLGSHRAEEMAAPRSPATGEAGDRGALGRA